MSNRRIFLIIGVAFALITLAMCTIIYSFSFSSTRVGRSYKDRSYYKSGGFIEASLLTWHEFSSNNRQINWLSFDDDTKKYYIAAVGENQIVSPSDNVRYLFDHGALGLSFSGDALKVIDYMSYGQEKGVIVLPLSATNKNCDILWETSGFIAYPFCQNR